MKDIRIIKIGQDAIFEMVYETFVEQVEKLFHIVNSRHVQYVCGMNEKAQVFWFSVYDDRLIYDEQKKIYVCSDAQQFKMAPLPDMEDFLVDSPEDPWQYRTIDLNGEKPRYAGWVKRLGTELRMIQLTSDEMVDYVNSIIYKRRKIYFGLRSTKDTEFSSLWNPQTSEYSCIIFSRGKAPSDVESILQSYPITTESMLKDGGRFCVLRENLTSKTGDGSVSSEKH